MMTAAPIILGDSVTLHESLKYMENIRDAIKVEHFPITVLLGTNLIYGRCSEIWCCIN